MTKSVLNLNNDENNSIELAFELFKEDKEAIFLSRDRFINAYLFFLSLYDPIKEEVKNEKLLTIQKAYCSLLNQIYFTELIKQTKTANRGLCKKSPEELNKNFIMKHLGDKHIVHIDRCWGKFDKGNLGYILHSDIKNCIDMVLSKYNTKTLNYQPYSNNNNNINNNINNNDDQQTVCSPPLKPINYKLKDDFIVKSKKNDSEKPILLDTDHELVKSDLYRSDECKSNLILEWLVSKDCKQVISFECFANFISQVIVDNNLTFVNRSTKCGCTIF